MEYAGELETHLTVASDQAQRIDDLREFAVLHGLKCLHIVLDQGQSTSQPMLTRHSHGVLSSELRIAQQLVRELQTHGFTVTRIKIEAAPFNQDIPLTDEDALRHSANQYFEHHVKLLLEDGADVADLTQLAQRHQAHLSRNALHHREDGRQERFVTQRCWSVGRTTAEQHLTALNDDLIQAGSAIVEVEAEFVVYDNNLEVDSGWITTEG